MALEPRASSILQSIRSSCDRCRFHKLKCNVPSGSDGPSPCERCTRAKVPCVFGRRRRANRVSDAKNPPPVTPRSTSPAARAALATPPPSSASAAASAYELPVSAAADVQLAGPMECEPESAVGFEAQPWESLALGLHDAPDRGPGQHGSMNGWDWLQDSFSSDDAYILGASPLAPTPWSPPPALLPPAESADGTVAMNGSTKTRVAVPKPRLLALITDMQLRLKMLEKGPWQHDSTCSLDDYPVDIVLHLSQEFGAIAGAVLNRACAAGTMMGSAAPQEPDFETAAGGATHAARCDGAEGVGAPSEAGVDTATTLLVLGGYMWLVRIYGTVLGHFQTHLSRISSGGGSITSRSGMTGGAGAAPELGRIYTTVCTLLEALHGVEEQLGRGGAVARNVVVALLTQEALLGTSELQDGYGGLGGKVRSLKQLLREKMGL